MGQKSEKQMNRVGKAWIRGICAMMLTASSYPALAQAGSGQAASDARAEEGPQEIVVTATRRETSLQSTSESLQVLTGDALNARGSTDFNSFFLAVPSLAQSDNRGPGNTRYSLRGVQSGGEPLVGVYYDEMPLLGSPGESLDPGGSQPDIHFWDIERVEVLKGPQGTLYGNGSAGGAIRIITSKPKADRIEGAARASLGTIAHGEGTGSFDAMLNLPIVTDRLALRTTGFYQRRGGYIDEIYLGTKDANRAEVYGGRATLRWTPTDDTTIDLSGYYQKTASDAKFEVFEGFGNKPVAASLVQTPFDDRLMLANLTVEQKLGFAALTYSGSYQNRRVTRNIDQTRFVIYGIAGVPTSVCPESSLQDRSCIALINAGPFGTVAPLDTFGVERNRSWVHELRLTSSGSGPFQWTLGLFHENRRTQRNGAVAATNDDGVIVPAGDLYQNTLFARNNEGTRKQIAVYGDLSYDLAQGLTATAGFRWFDIKRTEDQTLLVAFGGGQTGPQPTQRYKEKDAVFRGKLSWQATDDLLVYAIAAQGYRVGGPNQPVGFTTSAPPFNPDQLWNYELGWRASLMDRVMTLNGAVYYIDWKNVQFVTTDPTGAFTLIGNAGNAAVKGFELEANLSPARGLNLSGGVGYTDARFKGAQPVQGLPENQTRDGGRLPGVPRWSTTANLSYTTPISAETDLVLSGDWSYRSGQTTGFIPGVRNFRRLPGYHVVNARATVKFDQWDIGVEASNLFDVMPMISGRVVPDEPFQYATIQPRTFSLVANVRF